MMKRGTKKKACKAFKITFFLIYLLDCYHTYTIYKEEEHKNKSYAVTEEELKILKEKYSTDRKNKVSVSSFSLKHSNLREILDPNVLKISRESINFFASGRAVLLQLAHPYVSLGISSHSSLQKSPNSVQRRFYKTFLHVFSITFSSVQKVKLSSQVVRRQHENVFGVFMEDTGLFKKGEKYSANNIHAILWVHMTLIESQVLIFEMFIRRLSEKEKDSFLKGSQQFGEAFGLDSKDYPKTWKEFEKEKNLILNSNLLCVNNEAEEISSFLFCRDKFLNSGLTLCFADWISYCTLPPIQRKKFYGREDLTYWELRERCGKRINLFNKLLI
eukprot:snap_masked-scaffold_9-processed-gene-12.37-mRNA-1 protein AED:1.00 eAED:1.00 QI:0/0/0/0/1/1/3/0/329